MRIKGILTAAIIIVMTVFLPSLFVSADNSGSYWSYDETNKTLTITADIPDFARGQGTDTNGNPLYSGRPWESYKNDITTIIFQYADSSTKYKVGDGAFCGMTSLTTVINGYAANPARLILTYLGDHAFCGCTSLSSIPYLNVSQFGTRAFQNCSSLGLINISKPNSGTLNIPNGTFRGCSSLNQLYLTGDDVLKIGSDAFTGCTSLSELDIPTGLTSIADDAFGETVSGDRIENLTLVFRGNAPDLADNAFDGVNQLTVKYPQANSTWAALAAGSNKFGAAQITWTGFDPCGADGHKSQSVSQVDATCISTGTKSGHICKVCGAVLDGCETIEMTDHTYGDWQTVKEAECIEKGSEMRECSVCHRKETRDIAMAGHSWGDWTVTQAPTVNEEGRKERTCSRCSASDTQTVGKIVAMIGDTGYSSINDAIWAASEGDTIRLVNDVAENVAVPFNKDGFTLDLSGHTLSNSDDGSVTLEICQYAAVQIINGSEAAGSGKIVCDGDMNEKTAIENYGNLTITASIEVTADVAVMNCSDATLNISGGNLSSQSGNFATVVNEGTLNLSDGKIENQSSSYEAVSNKGTFNMTGGELAGAVTSSGSSSVMNISSGTVTGTVSASNPSNVHITGGSFRWDVSPYLDDDHVMLQNGQYYTVVGTVTVTVGSMVENGGPKDIAALSGGGKYGIGETVSVQAYQASGYEFAGWHRKSGDSYEEEVLSTAAIYRFTAASDTDLIAVYRVSSVAGTATLKVKGAGFTVNGGTNQKISNYTQKYPLNTEITITATGEDFLYWMNSSDKIVSADASYTFTLVRDMELTPVYKGAEEQTIFVEFVSPYDQIMQASNYDSTTVQSMTLPAGPSKSGYTFIRWDKSKEDISAALDSGEQYMRVSGVYEAVEESFSLKVVCDGEVKQDSIVTGNKTYTLTADEISGKKFDHWKDDLGNKLSTSSTYQYYLNRNAVITGVYVDSSAEVTKEPLVALTNVRALSNPNRLEYIIQRDVPEGYELRSYGVVYSTDSEYMDPVNYSRLVIGGTNVTAIEEYDKLYANDYYVLTMNIGGNVGYNLCVRGYITVQKVSDGTTLTIYTDVAAGCFNDYI